MRGVASKVIWTVHGTIVHSAVLEGAVAEVVEKSWDSQRTWECAGAKQVSLTRESSAQCTWFFMPHSAIVSDALRNQHCTQQPAAEQQQAVTVLRVVLAVDGPASSGFWRHLSCSLC
jgi:hypothetical protein